MTPKEQLAKVFMDLSEGCIKASKYWLDEFERTGLKSSDVMAAKLAIDSKRNAEKAALIMASP